MAIFALQRGWCPVLKTVSGHYSHINRVRFQSSDSWAWQNMVAFGGLSVRVRETVERSAIKTDTRDRNKVVLSMYHSCIGIHPVDFSF